MRSIAIDRVLSRKDDRSAIGSIADLREMYRDEIAANYAEIEAGANEMMALSGRTVGNLTTNWLAKNRPCIECGGPITGARRLSRWYCSPRCRQRAHRKALRGDQLISSRRYASARR